MSSEAVVGILGDHPCQLANARGIDGRPAIAAGDRKASPATRS
jgi:hypothetical protein